MGVLGDKVLGEVVVRFPGTQDVPLVKVEHRYGRGGGVEVGRQSSKQVSPRIACEARVRPDMGKVSGASSGV